MAGDKYEFVRDTLEEAITDSVKILSIAPNISALIIKTEKNDKQIPIIGLFSKDNLIIEFVKYLQSDITKRFGNIRCDSVLDKYPELQEPRAINILFDGPPDHTSGRFVEVEDDEGKSIRVGEWSERSDGLWALRIVGIF